jgi:hypothetical protein
LLPSVSFDFDTFLLVDDDDDDGVGTELLSTSDVSLNFVRLTSFSLLLLVLASFTGISKSLLVLPSLSSPLDISFDSIFFFIIDFLPV